MLRPHIKYKSPGAHPTLAPLAGSRAWASQDQRKVAVPSGPAAQRPTSTAQGTLHKVHCPHLLRRRPAPARHLPRKVRCTLSGPPSGPVARGAGRHVLLWRVHILERLRLPAGHGSTHFRAVHPMPVQKFHRQRKRMHRWSAKVVNCLHSAGKPKSGDAGPRPTLEPIRDN